MHTCTGILKLYEHWPHLPEEEKAKAGSRWHCSPLGLLLQGSCPPADRCFPQETASETEVLDHSRNFFLKIYSVLYKLALVSQSHLDQIVVVLLPKPLFRFHISLLYLLKDTYQCKLQQCNLNGWESISFFFWLFITEFSIYTNM